MLLLLLKRLIYYCNLVKVPDQGFFLDHDQGF